MSWLSIPHPASASSMAKSYMPYASRYPSYTTSSSHRYSGGSTGSYYSSGTSSPYTSTYMRRVTPSVTKNYGSSGSSRLPPRTNLQRISSPRVLPPSPLDRHATSYGSDYYQPRRSSATRSDARSTSRQPMKCDHSTQMTKAFSSKTSSHSTYGTSTSRLSRKDRAQSYSELNQINTELRNTKISDNPEVSLRRSKRYSSSYDVGSSSSSSSSVDRSRTTPNGIGTQNYEEPNDSLPDIQAPRSRRPASMDRYGNANVNGGIGSKAGLDGGSRTLPGSSTLAHPVEVSQFIIRSNI